EQLDLSAAGSTYNLNGGILQAGAGSFVGTAGNLNGGGGTLQITGSGAFTDPFNGTLATGTVTTFDASSGTVTSVDIAGNLSGGGGIDFPGPATAPAFSFSGPPPYPGATVIQNGPLTATFNQIAASNLLDIVDSNSILNLSTSNAGLNQL